MRGRSTRMRSWLFKIVRRQDGFLLSSLPTCAGAKAWNAAPPELAMGAIADGGSPIVVRNNDAIEMAGVSEADFAAACRRELKEIERRRTFVLRRSAASGGQRDASPLSSTRTRRFASRSTQILRGHSRERWANGPAATKACRTGRVDQRQTNERSR